MARNRVIYQSESLYVSEGINSDTAAKHEQLTRVQSANYSFTINRQDINEFGSLARLDSIIMESPTVNLDFSYYVTDGFNEKALGFSLNNNLTTQFLSGHMEQTSGKNYYITTAAEGKDADGLDGADDIEAIIGFGNAFLSDYTLDLAVGSLPTASVSLECANMRSVAGGDISGAVNISGMDNPAVDITNGDDIGGEVVLPKHTLSGGATNTIAALQPGDITINIENLDEVTFTDISGVDDEDAINIQSASLSIPLSRTPIDRLGTRFPYARSVDFPLNATLSVNGVVSDVQARNLSTIMNTNSKKDITLTLKNAGGAAEKLVFKLKGCRVDSESFSSSIGSNKSVDIVFSTQIGGTNDTNNGVFVSGANAVTPFE